MAIDHGTVADPEPATIYISRGPYGVLQSLQVYVGYGALFYDVSQLDMELRKQTTPIKWVDGHLVLTTEWFIVTLLRDKGVVTQVKIEYVGSREATWLHVLPLQQVTIEETLEGATAS